MTSTMHYLAPFDSQDGREASLDALERFRQDPTVGEVKFVVEYQLPTIVEKFDEEGNSYYGPMIEGRSLTVRFDLVVGGMATYRRNRSSWDLHSAGGWERHSTGPVELEALVGMVREFIDAEGERPAGRWRPDPDTALARAEERNGWVNPWAYRMEPGFQG